MTKILIVHPKATCISAKKLAAIMKADTYDLREGRRDFEGYDLVWNYGSSDPVYAPHLLNRTLGVQRCIDKVQTFEILHRNRVPTVDYTTFKHNVPESWETVVVRDKRNGRKAEGLHYVERGEQMRNGELYTEYFPHEYEYRIVVLCGEVVGRYRKDVVDKDWLFIPMLPQGFERLDRECIHAAKVLGIDYAGFDILENKRGKCVILEANSGAMIQDEALEFIADNVDFIVNYIKTR
jgi:glutathione synthase/RimK-type ligase-like ATP-grasp enzyme